MSRSLAILRTLPRPQKGRTFGSWSYRTNGRGTWKCTRREVGRLWSKCWGSRWNDSDWSKCKGQCWQYREGLCSLCGTKRQRWIRPLFMNFTWLWNFWYSIEEVLNFGNYLMLLIADYFIYVIYFLFLIMKKLNKIIFNYKIYHLPKKEPNLLIVKI